ncbi:MAG: hypothetical protein Q4F31_05165 [Eubacteriales bacterium]|nr:hypothetical protein [Eubacteriales bacterium]
MSFLLSHTVFYRFYAWHLLAVLFLLLLVLFCWGSLKKMKREKMDLEHELSSSSAEVALEPTPDAVSTDEVNAARKKALKEKNEL